MIAQTIFDDGTDDESNVKVSTPKQQKSDGLKGVLAENEKRNMEHESEEPENTGSEGAVKRQGWC